MTDSSQMSPVAQSQRDRPPDPGPLVAQSQRDRPPDPGASGRQKQS